MNRLLILFIALFLSQITLAQQQFVKSEFLEDFTQIELLGFGFPAENGIDLYKIWYTTPGSDNLIDTASGLLILPQLDGEAAAIVLSHHGTASPRSSIPSNQENHFGELFLGSAGFVVVAPDYLGMGESRGFHPYLHAETQASSAIDLLRAAKEFGELNEVAFRDELFVTGYSQGGHAAMATFRSLEQDFADEFPVTAAAPMSGPYNLSGTLLGQINANEEYFFPAYLTYIAKGFQEVYGNLYDDIGELFKEPYASAMRRFDNQEDYNLANLNDELLGLLGEEVGSATAQTMLQDGFVEDFQNGNLDNPIVAAIYDNNVYDWTPNAPTQLYYCEADEQVPFENAIFTDSIMNANGATDVTSLSMGAILGHGACAFLAFPDVSGFFKSFLFSNTDGLSIDPLNDIRLFPNPTTDFVFWQKEYDVTTVTLLDLQGKVLRVIETNDPFLSLRDLPAGIYLLELQTADGVQTKKIVKK